MGRHNNKHQKEINARKDLEAYNEALRLATQENIEISDKKVAKYVAQEKMRMKSKKKFDVHNMPSLYTRSRGGLSKQDMESYMRASQVRAVIEDKEKKLELF